METFLIIFYHCDAAFFLLVSLVVDICEKTKEKLFMVG